MTGSLKVVAADVGNSSVSLAALIEGTIQSCSVAIDQQSDWTEQAIACIEAWLPNGEPLLRVASVHPKASDELSEAAKRRWVSSHVQHLSYRDVPMKAYVEAPEQLGIDRLLSAYGAKQVADTPLVVIDAGTAITVDWVDASGDFRGGAIMPGLSMQLRSLASGTAALPEINWQSPQIERPAPNTERAMMSGVIAGVAGGIDRLISVYCDFAGHSSDGVRVVLTGGDGAAISSHLLHNHQQHGNLVCRAVLDLPRS